MKRKNRSKDKKIIVKIAGLLLGSILVSAAMLVNFDTFSWFSSNATGQISVTAAKTEDIIEQFRVVENNNNSTEIKIKKAENLKSSPVVFFSIEGEAADYILHMNPVALEGNKEYSIPIGLNINAGQFIKLLLYPDTVVKGKMRLKYLNEFIDEEEDISFSKEYLIKEFWRKAKDEEKIIGNIDDNNEAKKEAKDLIKFISKFINWDKDNSNKEQVQLFTTLALPVVNTICLSPEQNEIIDVIAPKLLPHLDELYAAIEDLSLQLNEKLAEIEKLNLQLQDRDIQIQVLQDEKLILEGKINDMTLQNEELQQYNTKLNEDIVSLDEIIASLEEKNKKLDRQNDSLSDENSSLSSENRQLKEQIEQLQKTIDELMTSDDNDTTVPEEVYGND